MLSSTLAFRLFLDSLRSMKTHWFGWGVFLFFVFMTLQTLSSLVTAIFSSGYGFVVSGLLFQFFFPVLLVGLFQLNKRLENSSKFKDWFSFVAWHDTTLLVRALSLGLVHLLFYVSLTAGVAFLVWILSLGTTAALFTFGFQIVLGWIFLFLTWRAPALLKTHTLRQALSTSIQSSKLYWQSQTGLIALFHLPLIPMAYGAHLCSVAIQSMAASGLLPLPEAILPALLQNNPSGVHVIALSFLVQIFFWFTVIRNYSPKFWAALPLPENGTHASISATIST